MTDQGLYEEHEKMSAVQGQLDALIEFLEEWSSQKGLALCQLVDSGKRTGFGSDVVMEYQPVFSSRRLVYEFLAIDDRKIEQERRQMLDDIRSSTL